jgi:hypothetical protein
VYQGDPLNTGLRTIYKTMKNYKNKERNQKKRKERKSKGFA